VVERALLDRLLVAEFPGRDELAVLLQSVLVRTIDDDGGLELRSRVEGKASVVQRVPVEAEGKGEDGVTIHMLLHVVDGRPVELEFFKEDSSMVKRLPSPSAFEPIVLTSRGRELPMLKRFWFKFNPLPLSRMNLGCGVTAYDYSDALKLLNEKLLVGNQMPNIAEVIEDVDISTLDQNHVIPNMEVPAVRGIWFPKGYR
jgi:hypothetical protein